MEGIIKVENISQSDGQLEANIAKSESTGKFYIDFKQNNEKPAPVVLETIPKSETEILCDELPSSSIGKDNPYNDTYSRDSDSNSEPECDPFADVDCDPSFSQKPLASNNTSSGSATQIQLINSDHVNRSSILPSSRKRVLSKQCETSIITKLECQLCLQTQSSEIKLKTHVEVCAASSHKNIRRFCVLCNKLFSTPWSYRFHARSLHGVKEPLIGRFPLKCPSCPRTFALKESLAAHSALNHKSGMPCDDRDGDRPISVPNKCPECPSTFAKPLGLQFHVIHYHKNARRFKCPELNCGRAFNTSCSLQDHRIRAHTDEKPFMCQALNCGKAFKTKKQLQRHMAFHSVERPFKCPHADCSKMFASKEYVRAHLPVHTRSRSFKKMPKEGSFTCEQCERTFYKRYLLNAHLKTHHRNDEGPIKCPEPDCKTTFKYKNSLKLHIVNMHTNPDDLRVPCPEPQCGKIFKNANSLRQHIAYIHSTKDAVSFKCTQPNCYKTFKNEKGVKDHLRYHTRPEKCKEPGCSAMFALPRALNKHIQYKHKNV